MAEKVSLKIFIVISLFCGILSACRHPIDIQAFMEDEEIQKIIAATKVAVKLSDDSDKGLTGGNRIISGLNPNKYYMVEKELDEDGITEVTPNDYPKFVTDFTSSGAQIGPGGLSPDLEYITRISGGKINRLTNLHTYTVRSATNFIDDTEFTYSVDNVDQPPLSVTDGKITIPASIGTIKLVDLDTLYTGYDVMAVAVTPPALPNTSPFYNTTKTTIDSGASSSFLLEAASTADTITDYVFAKTDGATVEFNVLKIEVKAPTYGITLDKTGTHTFNAGIFGSYTPDPLTVTVTNTGNQPTGALTVALSGTNLNDFTVMPLSLTSIDVDDDTTFTVEPKSGLNVGNYIATVTVSGGNSITASFNVSFTVNPVPSGGVKVNITFTYSDVMNSLFSSNNSATINRGTYNGSNSVVLTLNAAPSGFSWTNITWDMEGGDLSARNGNNTATVTNSTPFLPALAGSSFKVTVTAKLKANSVVSEPPVGYPVYSAKVTINVEN